MERGDYRRQGWMIGNHDLADPGHAPPGRSILHAALNAFQHLLQADADAVVLALDLAHEELVGPPGPVRQRFRRPDVDDSIDGLVLA